MQDVRSSSWRPHWADVLAVVYTVGFYLWLFARTPGTPQTATIGMLAFVPLGLGVTWAAWRTSAVTGLDARTRLSWRLNALSALSLWATGNLWALDFWETPEAAGPDVSELFNNLYACIAVAAYLALPRTRIAPADRRRWLLDAGLVLVAAFVLVFYFEFRAIYRPNLVHTLQSALLNTVVDWAAFATAIAVYLRSGQVVNRRVLRLFVGANLCSLFANFVLAESETYRIGDWVDGVYFLAWVLRWSAARLAWHHYQRHGVDSTSDVTVPYRSSMMPHLLVTGGFLMLLGLIALGDTKLLAVPAAAAGVMTALLMLRQMAEIRENGRLFQAAAEQEQRFRSLVQHSSDVVLVVDADRRVAYVSPAADGVLGARNDLCVGAALADVVAGDDEGVRRLTTPGETVPERVQCRMSAADGSSREMEIVSSDLRDEPSVGGIVLNCRDVTDRHELERQLRHAQKLEAIGQLAGGLAHDFNNVLAVIRGYSDLLKLELPEQGQTFEAAQHLDAAVDRATTITRKLLAFSRRQPAVPVVIDLKRTLKDLQPMLRQLLPSKTEARVECVTGLWNIKADPGQVEQVLLNLASNARDAMPEGGRLTVRAYNRPAGPGEAGEAVPAGDYAVIEVTDEGVGMTREVQARIFEPFFSTKPRDKGSGLGLAMVYGIVSEAGGFIRVRSAPREGTTFTILWPRTVDLADVNEHGRTAPGARAGGATVLLVEDEAGVRALTTRLLERAGYSVIQAASGDEAMNAIVFRGTRVDLLLTDLVMPGMSGVTLVERFGTLRPSVPIVCMTGFAGEHPSLDGRVVAVIDKPFSADTLKLTVARALRTGPATPDLPAASGG